LKKLFLITATAMFLVFAIKIFGSYKTTQAISYKYGSRGATVIEIQTKLKNWGYYTGAVDGAYGYNTYLAVKYFQRKNGLNADGIAGDRTLGALGIKVTSASQATGDRRDSNLLGRVITGEARGEVYTGQVAIGGVIMNRTRDPRFPSTIPEVIYQPGAFTAVDDGQISMEPVQSCLKAANDALNGWDPSGGAIYYYNPATATNKWIWSRPVIKVIGKHKFCR
jgi:N-acetylmuramoyl-L-alanine amidase